MQSIIFMIILYELIAKPEPQLYYILKRLIGIFLNNFILSNKIPINLLIKNWFTFNYKNDLFYLIDNIFY